jgi:hypothetical protein
LGYERRPGRRLPRAGSGILLERISIDWNHL